MVDEHHHWHKTQWRICFELTLALRGLLLFVISGGKQSSHELPVTLRDTLPENMKYLSRDVSAITDCWAASEMAETQRTPPPKCVVQANPRVTLSPRGFLSC